MDSNKNYVELVEQARLGNRHSLDILSQKVRGPLFAYVYRITLQEDISQDIVQESMLEMFNNLDNLVRTDRFWPWLCKIAFNKIRHHYKNLSRHKTVSISDTADWLQAEPRQGQTGLSFLAGEELRQLVFDAMRQLKPKHRAVLAMRCYEEMQYSQIAQLMDSSELTARVLFYRAKEALHKQLFRRGLGKSFLLSALALFGKMTAPSEAAVPSVTVTATATKVGAAAALAGAATSKTTVVTLTAAAVLATGAIMTPLPIDKAIAWTDKTADSIRQTLKDLNAVNTSSVRDEYWYYYPDKTNGPVITCLIKRQPQTKQSYCQRFEDDHANYYLDKQNNTLHIKNCRTWQDNLAVTRLPTDSPSMTSFLSMIEGKDQCKKTEYVSSEQSGLLIIAEPGESDSYSHINQHYNVLDEEYFRYNRPTAVKVVDHRDVMHKRGWTYFRVTGHINGEEVSGTGRIPFVYSAYRQFYPWLRLNIAHRLEITSGLAGADIYNAEKQTRTTYPSDTFFKGLARPWMGLHAIDTIRRDAAEQQTPFETKYTPGNPKAEVVINREQTKIVYDIDMEKDIIEKITLLTNTNNGWKTKAELKFSYLENVTNADTEFAEPMKKYHEKPQQQEPGMLWLIRLVEGDLD